MKSIYLCTARANGIIAFLVSRQETTRCFRTEAVHHMPAVSCVGNAHARMYVWNMTRQSRHSRCFTRARRLSGRNIDYSTVNSSSFLVKKIDFRGRVLSIIKIRLIEYLNIMYVFINNMCPILSIWLKYFSI